MSLRRLAEGRPRAAAAVTQARAAGDRVVLREAPAVDGFQADEADAGDRLRIAALLPGLAGMTFAYHAPERGLAEWHLWRGEPDPTRGLLQEVMSAALQRGPEERVHAPG